MFAQIVRRLAIAAPAMLAMISAAFLLIHAAPGGPFSRDARAAPEIARRLDHAHNADRPAPEQLGAYLLRVLHGDLGPSMRYKDKTVVDIIADGLPTSALLCAAALCLALSVGVSLGMIAALRQSKPHDHILMGLAAFAIGAPILAVGPVLSWALGVELHWLPVGGLHRDEYGVRYLVLPVLTLALPQIALVARQMRAGMIDALRSDAIRTARAKGLPERKVIWRHAAPMAILPVAAQLGSTISGVLIGGLIVENMFRLPGVGWQFVAAAHARDDTTVLGGVIVYAVLIVVFNLAAAVLSRALDPRMRHA
ncbi:MAG TPA: ABC transporter permease [Caulobacterales bacterium]|nr:ABC transporter permease [Caulobacterales bacterium]